MRVLRTLVLALAAALSGCAALDAPFRSHLESGAPPVRECAEWYRDLDERVAAAGVRDAGAPAVAGFPYLRVNRLLASLREAAAKSELALQALVERMLALDREARAYEIMNLPSAPGDFAQVRAAVQRTQDCGRLLRDADLARVESRDALLERAVVPDDYSSAQRLLGLYALTRQFFAAGVRRYEEDTRRAFQMRTLPTARAVRYAPPPAVPLPRSRVALILERSAQNPFGIPEPGDAELRELLAAYAPSLEIEMAGDYDRIGALGWLHDPRTPSVDGARPVIYGHPAWVRYRDRVLLQLVYTFWFSERPPLVSGDLLAGKLDGLVWRVTLAPDGEPLVYDSIHPCGCYHQFFPTPRAAALPAPGGSDEWLFMPQTLPRIAPAQRPLLRIASATHMIEGVSLVQGTDSLSRYDIVPFGQLRSLGRGGGRASAFGPDGLIAGTERAERFLFWPTGIASPGAMRQWGRHATAFVGRRHFDDPHLLERRFKLELR